MSVSYPARLVTPNPRARFTMPLGMLGVLILMALMVVLPHERTAVAFEIGRAVFTVLYLGWIAFSMTTRRREARIVPSYEGLRDEQSGELLMSNAKARDVLYCPKGATHELQVRGDENLTFMVNSEQEAQEILRELGRTSGVVTLHFLAKTTPLVLMILMWMGFPLLCTFFFVGLSGSGSLLDSSAEAMKANPVLGVLPFLPFVFVWLFGTYWFARRREILLTPTGFTFPRLLGGNHEYAYTELESARAIDSITLELTLHSGRRHKFQIYNPDEVLAYLRHMQSHLTLGQIPDVGKAIPDASVLAQKKSSKWTSVVAIVIGLFLTGVTLPIGWHKYQVLSHAQRIDGVVVGSQLYSGRNNSISYMARVEYQRPDGTLHQVIAGSHDNEPSIVGEHRVVLFNPAYPNEVAVDDFLSKWAMAMPVGIGFAALIFGIFELRKWRRPRSH